MTIYKPVVFGLGSRRGRDRMVVGFITTYAITTNFLSSNPAQARCT